MQVLFTPGVEHGVATEGFAVWPGTVERLDAPVLPHMGWNTVSAPAGLPAVRGPRAGERFYFVHSYAARTWERRRARRRRDSRVSEHGEPLRRGRRAGPGLRRPSSTRRKSGDAGAALLGHWLALP